MIQNIPEIFKSSDVVYHYCPMNTAIEHILFKKQLKFSHRKKSTDPIEQLAIGPYPVSGIYSDELEMEKIELETKDLVEKMKKELSDIEKKTMQLCFCKNGNNTDFIDPKEEYYGFLKPRMWDQYGDKYKGVCLAFSRKKLEELHEEYGDVNYVAYDFLHFNYIRIYTNELIIKDFDSILEQNIKKMKKILYNKHLDYQGEDEFRMISFDKEYIDVSTALIGIVVSIKELSEFAVEQIIKYTDQNQVELIFINWLNSGIDVISKKWFLSNREILKKYGLL